MIKQFHWILVKLKRQLVAMAICQTLIRVSVLELFETFSIG